MSKDLTINHLLTRLSQSLIIGGLSSTTQKLYLLDVRRFLRSQSELSIANLTSKAVYRKYLLTLRQRGVSQAQISRELAALKHLGRLISTSYSVSDPTSSLVVSRESNGHIKLANNDIKVKQPTYRPLNTHNLAGVDNHTNYTDPKSSNDSQRVIAPDNTHIARANQAKLTSHRLSSFSSLWHRLASRLAVGQTTRPPARMSDSGFRLGNLLSLVLITTLFSALLYLGYRQLSRDQVRLTEAYPSTPVTPSREISFQGRLEDSSGAPITSATNFVFKLWDDSSGGSQLYTTGTCSITPDSDGVFTSRIGDTCGSAIDSSVFTENASVYLEVTVGAETLTPRQEIATVAYALNSETLQGFPISATVSAVRNTVVPMNQWGEILIGEQAPRLTGVSGNFTISAPSLTLGSATTTSVTVTTDGTGNSEVVLPADSIGPDEVLSAGQVDEYCLKYESTGDTWAWGACGTGGGGESLWRINLGALSPVNDTLDLLVGSNATSSANAGFINIDNGTPTATVSAGTAGAASLTATGVLGTTAYQSLTLGNSTTGNVILAAGGTTSLTAVGNDLTTADQLTVGGALLVNGNTTLGNAGSDSITFTGSIAQDSDLIPITTTGTSDLGSSSIPWDNLYTGNISFGSAGTLTLPDNTASALRILEGSNVYLDITTTNNQESFSLNLPTGGATSHTANLFTSNIAQTLNLGTGTAADTFNFGTGGTAGDTFNFGATTGATTYTFNSGATTTNPLTFDFDTLTTGTGLDLSLDGLTTGTGLLLDNAGNSLTTGTLLQAQSTATSLTTAGDAFLAYLNWNPGSATTATGDLFRLNIGSNGDATNLFNITDNGSSLFRVSETQIESALPHAFTAAGDVAIAYDLNFTNQTASTIGSYGPLTIRSGESFENNDLTLSTYGTGNIVLDPASTGYIQLEGATRYNGQLTLENSATPDVSGGTWFVTGGTTTITDFDAGSGTLEDGHLIVIESAHAVTIDCAGSTEFDCGTTDIVLADNDLISFIYDAGEDIWRLVGWVDESTNGGQDLAEYFPSSQILNPGEVVKVDPGNSEHVIRSTNPYESQVVGIVATNPGIILGTQQPDTYPIALAGRVPVNVYPGSSPISPGDYLTTSPNPGKVMKSHSRGRVIGQALQSWNPGSGESQITVFINNTWYDPLTLTENGELAGVYLATDDDNPDSVVLTDSNGLLINKLSGLVSLITDTLRANYAEIATLLSPSIQTNLISPLASGSAITIEAPVRISPPASSTTPALTIDGDLQVATLSARTAKLDTLEVKNLVAEHISASSIEGLEATLATLSAHTTTSLSDEELESLTARLRSRLESIFGPATAEDLPTPTLSELPEATPSGEVNFASDNGLVANLNALTITTETVTANSGLLSLQPLGVINLASGTLVVDSSGTVSVKGNLDITGSLAIHPKQGTELGDLLTIYNSEGGKVASVDASGSATLSSLATNQLTILGESTASPSGILSNILEASASAGVGTITSPNKELTINTPYVTEGSLIYITPTGPTDNQVLYIKSQVTCPEATPDNLESPTCVPSFTVAVNSASTVNIPFNWWIVKLASPTTQVASPSGSPPTLP